jgi:GNAT superfamily N-acetyltransferase
MTARVPATTIRPARDDDLAALRSLLGQLGYDLPLDEIRRRLAAVGMAPDHAVLVGESNGRVVALLHLFVRPALEKPPEVIVQALVVDSRRRQGGVGKAMMKAAERWAQARDLRSVALSSHVAREDAHAFYKALGYEHVATSRLLRKSL